MKTLKNKNNTDPAAGTVLKDLLSRNTMMYLVITSLMAVFLYVILKNNQNHSLLLSWLIIFGLQTATLARFHHLLSLKINPFNNTYYTSWFLINGLLWGMLGGIFLSKVPSDSQALIIMALVAVIALGIPLITSSYKLSGLFSSAVLLPSACSFALEMNAVSFGKSIFIIALIPVFLRVVKVNTGFQTRSNFLIDQLNKTMKKMKAGNLELKKEISDKKQTEEALIKARDDAEAAVIAKGEFLASMSHEIRTPMNGVLGMAELLIDTDLTNKQKRFAETIHKSGNALLTIINDILDFSKIEAGKLELNKTVFDLRLLIEEVGLMFADQAYRKGLELTCDFPASGHPTFRGDAERIRQILVNLLGNALKFTEKGEVILKVEIFEKDNDLCLIRFRVRDTGIGIDPAVQGKIFNSFSQADGSTTRKFGGTGLGLTICKKLIQLMNGKVGIKSQLGQGATFWFAIPLKKEAAVKQSISKSIIEPLKDLRVLIADANKTNCALLEQQLKNWGMDYYSVGNGKNVPRIMKEAVGQGKPFSLAIIDSKLPGLDGISLARKINNDQKLSETKLIILSSIGNMEETGQWLMAGIEGYLNKPIRQNELYECVSKALLPEKPENSPPDQNQPTPQNGGSFLLKGHVLVAEDNLVNQELVKEMLANLGCTVEIADNGQKAFEAISDCLELDSFQQPYDLVLMDCQMPVMDGFEATRKIRNWEEQQAVIQRIPIIALTANAMEGDREKCLSVGMDDYMTKPFNLGQLGAILHHWLPLLAKENKSAYARQNESAVRSQSNDTSDKTEERVAQINVAAINKIRKLQRKGQPNVVVKVIKLFLENSQKTIFTLESAISKGDHATLHRSAYSLHSSCSTVGATDLAKVCSELEMLGKAGDSEKAQSRLSVLEYEYDAVCIALNKLIDSEKAVAA